nr:hypothetical protein [Sinorhizobium meliloti]
MTEEKLVPVPVTRPSLGAPWWKSKEMITPSVIGGGASLLTAIDGIPWQNLLLILVAFAGIAGFLYWRKNADRKAVAKQVEGMARWLLSRESSAASRAAGSCSGAPAATARIRSTSRSGSSPERGEEGRKLERAELDPATNKAIGELRDEADRARFNRRLCIERGRLYVNATGLCVERPPQPYG